ncbi:MAG: adenylosuccinate synthase [Anaerolineales bacterium]|nr:adenylosuccinate synthase [Anaerolineales bacterium]
MPLNIIIGTQWGDEGKGRVVDLLAGQADYVARYNGGDNAGHTVQVGKQTFKLHLIPSGVIQPHTVGVIGNGLVVNPAVLLQEVEMLRALDIEIGPKRLKISHAAHIITPAHLALDAAREQARGIGKIGTTLRGIGPAYNHKTERSGLRVEAMRDLENFAESLKAHVETINKQLTTLYNAEPLYAQAVAEEYVNYAHQLKPYISNVSILLSQALQHGENVLAEGAQGTLLDLDHGTYPYVTSSNPTAPGALVGLGLGVGHIGHVIGVTKSFQTRVGEGPFPTEVDGSTAGRLRGTGVNPWDEFGTTTGRPRRVGWLDIVLLRYALRVNGVTELTITKLDVLSGMDALKICVGYRAGDQVYADLPLGPTDLDYEPVYEELNGWREDIMSVRAWDDLPAAAQAYVEHIEALCGVPAKMISVGPEREQIIQR